MRLSALAALLMFAAAACGGSDDGGAGGGIAEAGQPDSADEGSKSTAREVWTGNLEGAPTTVEVAVPSTEAPELAAVEAFREMAGVAPVEYIRVTIDNSAGDSPNAPSTIDINGGDGTDPTLAISALCTDLGFFWEVPFDDSLSADDAAAEFDAGVAARDEAFEGLGCGPGDDEIAPGATASYWLSRPLTDPPIESLRMRFNDFERS